MKKLIALLMLACFIASSGLAQDSIKARIIFIGNAGEPDKEQQALIPMAARQVLPGITKVIYLGNNVASNGFGLTDGKEEPESEEILRAQYQPMRAAGAVVYFMPGNRDWDGTGPLGLAKIKKQWEFLQGQNDSLLRFVPANGCPDPVEINIDDSLVIIALDSEWWLFPFDRSNGGADCNCSTSRDVVNALDALLYKNRHKTILLATHHPFQRYGIRGGNYTFKDHIFPLTHIQKDLYLPLPVIGSAYPLFRSTFTSPEDVDHPLYQEMISKVDNVFKDFPNLVHIAGGEEGLQMINDPVTKQLQIISGKSEGKRKITKGKNLVFGGENNGFVVADRMEDNTLKFIFYRFADNKATQVFQYVWTPKPYHITEEELQKEFENDSVTIAAHPAYDQVSRLQRFIMGKNYRKEWATPVRLPVIKISTQYGGLLPDKLGGGFQSTSLRLKDKNGKAYSLRTVEKSVELVVPEMFRGTFVKDVLDDATSAQHPYSSLVVPTLADAIGVPHSSPLIGVVAADTLLQYYQNKFLGRVALLEDRDPLGKSDNYEKFEKELMSDNDNRFDGINFQKARMLDLFLGDWDRHSDQWRFYNSSPKKGNKNYTIVPRDRDMALYLSEGFLAGTAKRIVFMPLIYGFGTKLMPLSNYLFFKSSYLNAYPSSQINYQDFLQLAQEVQKSLTDSVLERAIRNLPGEICRMDHDKLLTAMQSRRKDIVNAADKYYKFSNRIVDIRLSNKNEFVRITDRTDSGALQILVLKINKNDIIKDTIISKTYPKNITKEIRLYLSKGDDSVVIDNQNASTKLRIIGGKGDKAYNILSSKNSIKLYDKKSEMYYGDISRLNINISDDSAHTAFMPTNYYNNYFPLLNLGINPDDGISLGAGLRFTGQNGFRKTPYAQLQQVMINHSFGSKAFSVRYSGEWTQLWGKADLLTFANINAPRNTQNFFGVGNETVFDKKEGFQRYYRARFTTVESAVALRWRQPKGSSFYIGPAIQYYNFDRKENEGRFILQTVQLNAYDSAFIEQKKINIGLIANYTYDNRNNTVLPQWGSYINIALRGYDGVRKYAASYIQVEPQIALYKCLNERRTIVLAERLGGGISLGRPGFYQSLFLGGEGTLSGYRKFRFAGQHTFYNNLELRIALADFGNYILKGELGLTGFYDIGRVWRNGEHSDKWHNGIGGGLYFAPAQLVVFRINAGYSEEGWYPTFGMGIRF